MQANSLLTFDPLGEFIWSKHFSESAYVAYKLKEKTRRAKFKQMFDLMQIPELSGCQKGQGLKLCR